jgi:membrane protein implicated in regulation of membrane protease activity
VTLPTQPTPQSSQPGPVRVFHISVRPKTWFGRLLAWIIAPVVLLVALFFSIVAFAILASIAALAFIYFVWTLRRARRAMRNQTIEGEAKHIDIR